MLKLIPGLILAVATVLVMPAVGATKSARKDPAATGEKAEAAAPADKEAQQKLKEHLRMRNHIVKNVKYPATKETLVAAFKNLKDVKPGDKKWLEETLPSRTFDSSDDVVKALGWEVAPAPDDSTTAAKSGK